MLKKFKALLAFILVFTFVFCPLVKADNETPTNTTTENTEVQAAETTTNQETTAGTKDEEIKEKDVYLFGDDVTVDYAVDGNAFIFGNTVNIKNKISGDLFVFANQINIDGGYVYSNVFACGNELKISGVIYDLYAACAKIEITENGYVYRDAHSISDTLNLYGTVGRNALVGANTMSFQKDEDDKKITGKVYGDLTYSTNEEMEIPEKMVEGNVKFEKFDTEAAKDVAVASIVKDAISDIITAIVYTILIYLALVWLAPKFTNKLEETLTKNVGSVIGFGILTIIALPIISLVLIMTSIGASAGLLLATLYGVLLAVASSITVITISKIVSNKFNINNKFAKVGVIAGISLVYGLLKLIPIISGLATIACGWVGTGIVVKQVLPSKEKAE